MKPRKVKFKPSKSTPGIWAAEVHYSDRVEEILISQNDLELGDAFIHALQAAKETNLAESKNADVVVRNYGVRDAAPTPELKKGPLTQYAEKYGHVMPNPLSGRVPSGMVTKSDILAAEYDKMADRMRRSAVWQEPMYMSADDAESVLNEEPKDVLSSDKFQELLNKIRIPPDADIAGVTPVDLKKGKVEVTLTGGKVIEPEEVVEEEDDRHDCHCDYKTVVARYGCQCGGK